MESTIEISMVEPYYQIRRYLLVWITVCVRCFNVKSSLTLLVSSLSNVRKVHRIHGGGSNPLNLNREGKISANSQEGYISSSCTKETRRLYRKVVICSTCRTKKRQEETFFKSDIIRIAEMEA